MRPQPGGEGREMKNDTITHCSWSVCSAAEGSLTGPYKDCSTQPSVLFLFLIDSLSLSAYCFFISQSLSLFFFYEEVKPSVSLPCNPGRCPTCVAASVTETKRNDLHRRPICCCLSCFSFLFLRKMTEVQMNK